MVTVNKQKGLDGNLKDTKSAVAKPASAKAAVSAQTGNTGAMQTGESTPIFKKKWFWAIIAGVVVALAIVGVFLFM